MNKKNRGKLEMQYEKQYELDEYDKKLLKALDQDARQQLSALAPQVGLSRDAVKNRIAKLQKAKVITCFKPIYNPPAMGYPIINYVFISLYNPSAKKEQEFLSFLKGSKHVTYAASLIGKWDYILDIMAPNQGEFDKVLKSIRQRFPRLIKDYEVYGVVNEYKHEAIGRLAYD